MPSTSVAHREESGAPVAQPEAGSIMSIIGRMASDPAMDIDKFERLLGFQEREVARQAEQAFNAAMSAAQAEMEPVRKDAKSDKGKYASYDALDQAIRPIYTKHGFGLSFDTGDSPKADDIRLLCYVTHENGGARTYRLDMAADGKGAKGGDVMTRTHATGSAVTYGQRYLLKMVFNIAVSTDDNGNAAGAQPITQVQADDLQALMDEVGADRAKFLNYMRAESLAQLPASKFKAALAALEAKRAKS